MRCWCSLMGSVLTIKHHAAQLAFTKDIQMSVKRTAPLVDLPVLVFSGKCQVRERLEILVTFNNLSASYIRDNNNTHQPLHKVHLPVTGLHRFCLQDWLTFSWYRFNKVHETSLRHFGPCGFHGITQLLQIFWLHIHDVNLLFYYISYSVGFWSGTCGGHLDSLWHSRNQFEMIWVLKMSTLRSQKTSTWSAAIFRLAVAFKWCWGGTKGSEKMPHTHHNATTTWIVM